MGAGPIYTQLTHPAAQERLQEQGYQQQFQNAAYMPIPGFNGQRQGAPSTQQQTSQSPWTSQWNELNGRLIGDTYLPPDVSTVDVGKGWYEVHHGGGRVGTLRPGGPNGRFINDTGAQMPQPGLVGAPPVAMQPGTAMPIPPQQRFAASGPYGAQAMQMAGLLGQQPSGPAAPPGESMGLLGGKRGFRVPGGK